MKQLIDIIRDKFLLKFSLTEAFLAFMIDGMRLKAVLVFAGCFTFAVSAALFAQNVPPGKEASGIERTQELEKQDQSLRERVEKKAAPPEVAEQPAQPPSEAKPQEKIPVKDIRVIATTLLPQKEIDTIIAPYKNKDLTIAEMQKAAGLITEAYRKKGYITSRAYLAPQKIENGVLEIAVLEGKMGTVDVKGNRYFKSDFFKKRITLKKGEPFNYDKLRKGLAVMNQTKDRSVRTVLLPGKEPGETDVTLKVKDRLPIHAGFDWDNFGSRYIGSDRYAVRVSHNNLLGLDDVLSFQYQLAEASRYFLKNVRYLLPVGKGLKVGAYAAFSRVKLGKEFEDFDVRGKSKVYGLSAMQSLWSTDNMDLNLNAGFDYKDITNYQLQTVSSTDRLRVAKLGLDFDATDNFGRSIISQEIDFGLSRIMGGLRERDNKASRPGAGGKFVKNSFNLVRLQKMPFSSTLLWKSQMQISPYILASSEEFQIGGIANVRGYPPAEVVGDNGYATTFEWAFPPYLVPRSLKVPFSQAKFYDAFRIVAFYDWANTRLRRPLAGEEKDKTLRGAGFGFRFNLPEDLSVRVDLAWPLDNTPSDGSHLHTWASVSKTF